MFAVAWQYCELVRDASLIGCCGPVQKVKDIIIDFTI